MAKHKYPRFVQFVDDVPKNDRGKVDRKALRAREQEQAVLRSGVTPKAKSRR
jgi:acyl-coenzyme A synthetase/AMP-(fatty) acid ligase